MRKYSVNRKTKETDIKVDVNLDGRGKSNINTGIGFLDHMIDQISKHSLIDINIHAKGISMLIIITRLRILHLL